MPKYLTVNETHECKTHEDAFEYLVSWLKANESKITVVSTKVDSISGYWFVWIHATLREEE